MRDFQKLRKKIGDIQEEKDKIRESLRRQKEVGVQREVQFVGLMEEKQEINRELEKLRQTLILYKR